MYNTLKEYIQTQTQVQLSATGKTIADYVLELDDAHFALFEDIYQKHKNNSPVTGKRILFNQHQDSITWMLVLLYQALGAEVHTSKFGTKALDSAAAALEASRIPYYEDSFPPDHDIHTSDNTYFARVFDCGAGTLNLRYLTADVVFELTQTDPHRYNGVQRSKRYQSINNLGVKLCETFLGTGTAIIDTVYMFMGEKLRQDNGEKNTALRKSEMDLVTQKRFKSQYYVIIGGAGNVAAGTAHALLNRGVEKNHILLVDLPEKRNTGLVTHMDNLKDIHFLQADLSDKVAFKNALFRYIRQEEPHNTDLTEHNFLEYIVMGTMTGVPGLFTKNNCYPGDFPGIMLFNGGHYDEFGKNFKDSPLILGGDVGPINFSAKRINKLGYATEPKFVFPCMAAMAAAGLQPSENTVTAGLQDVPIEIDKTVFHAACKAYPDGGFTILTAKIEELHAKRKQRIPRDILDDVSDVSSDRDDSGRPSPNLHKDTHSNGIPTEAHNGSMSDHPLMPDSPPGPPSLVLPNLVMFSGDIPANIPIHNNTLPILIPGGLRRRKTIPDDSAAGNPLRDHSTRN